MVKQYTLINWLLKLCVIYKKVCMQQFNERIRKKKYRDRQTNAKCQFNLKH